MSDDTSGVGEGFRRVDTQADPTMFFRLLDRQAQLPGIIALRRAGMRLLAAKPGQRLIEIGCGTGEAAREMAAAVAPGGSVVAIDYSEQMLQEARRRTGDEAVEYAHGDAQSLDYPDASFDGARAERTLQHLSDPGRALSEMIRVVRPGGRIVVLDTDWDSASVDMEDDSLRQTLAAAGSKRFANGSIGRKLYGMFKRAGLSDVSAEPSVFLVTGSMETFSGESGAPRFRPLEDVVAAGVKDGYFTTGEGEAVLRDLRAAEAEERIFFAVMMFAVGGTKP